MPSDIKGSAAPSQLGAVVEPRLTLAEPPATLYLSARFLLIVPPLLLIGGSGLYLGTPGALAITFVGLFLGVFGARAVARRPALGCAVTLHERGLVVSDRKTEQSIPFSQVESFSFQEQPLRKEGKELLGQVRTLTLVWAGGRVHLAQFADENTEDVFASVLSRVREKLVDAAEAKLELGASVRGKEWALDSQGLSVKGQAPVRLRDLTSLDASSGWLSFWRTEDEDPLLSISDRGPNAWVLSELAQRRMAGRERSSTGALGRLIFQRRAEPDEKRARLVMMVFIGAVGVGMAYLSHVLVQEGRMPLAVGILFPPFLWAMAAVVGISAFTALRVYERGVVRTAFFRTRTLRYSELAGFQFGATRNYTNGIYSGTALDMRFIPRSGAGGIAHRQVVNGGDADLNSLRDQVSDMVAHHLLERLSQGEEVPWGKHARFTSKALVIQKSRWFGTRSRAIPYDAGLGYSIKDGFFFLGIENEKGAVLVLECSAPNFYPGLKMLGVMCTRAETDVPRALG